MVENAETLSKSASWKVEKLPLAKSGTVPNTLIEIHASATKANTLRIENFIVVFLPAKKKIAPTSAETANGTAKLGITENSPHESAVRIGTMKLNPTIERTIKISRAKTNSCVIYSFPFSFFSFL